MKKMSITALFRAAERKFNPLLPPSPKNAGGGVAVKLAHLKAAVPEIELIKGPVQMGDVNIVEGLWFGSEISEQDPWENRIQRYVQAKGIKIFWTSDVEFARWNGCEREMIFEASDYIAGNSKYMQNVLRAYTPDPVLLTDPVDTSFIEPRPKTRSIFGMSSIIPQKNIESLTEIFQKLSPDLDLQKGFIGGRNIWGLNLNPESSHKLETDLNQSCDWRIADATRAQVIDKVSTMWAYAADTRFESFCYAMIEAMLAGCWCFCGTHLIYEERPCIRFDSSDDAVEKIKAKLDEGIDTVNEEGRQFVFDNYSLPVFRNQLKDLIGGQFGI